MDFTYNACVNETLLQTKLYIPPLRPSLLPRPRLLAKLEHGLDPHTAFFSGRIALICAPAGYGKTTLVGEWLAELTSRNSVFRRQNGRVGWLSLDEQDNDAARFLTYLIAALQRAVLDLGKEVQTALASTQPVSINTLITYLVNDLARLEQPLVLVLDDYHQIREQEIHHAITFLLDNQPPNLYLVLTARRNPPFPLARWRARGHLLEVRQADLKFTRPEIETFFQQATGVNLDQNSLDTLEQRTEGWVASLQLAAIAVQTPEDQPGAAQINKLISSFSGTHQYIADYLLSEVMAQRPSGTRQFLLQTAILERFSASLCAAVTRQEDSQATIEQLQAANLFLIPLDEERHWYRYHHLFAALLRQRLQAQDADQVPQLYLRASLWHEAHGYWEEAIEAALAGGHLERAAGLISDVAQTAAWQQGQYGRLARWIGQLPQELLRRRPQLCIVFAWALYVNPQQEDKNAPLRWLAAAEKAVAETGGESEEGRAILGQAAAIRSSRARIQGDIAGAIDLAGKALALLPIEPSFWRAIVQFNLAATRYLGDDDEVTQQTLLNTEKEAQAAGDRLVELGSMNMLAQLKVRQGDLRQAETFYRHALATDERLRTDMPWLLTGGMAHLGLGALTLEWNDLPQAAEHLQQGLNIGQRTQHPITLLAGRLVMARLALAGADQPAALIWIEEAATLAEATGQVWTWLTGPVAAALARLWLCQDEPLRAQDVLQKSPDALAGDPQLSGYWHEQMLLAQVRLLLAQGKTETAVPLLSRMVISAEQTGRRGSLVEILLLQSLYFHTQGQTTSALSALTHALSLAEAGGYVRLFVDEGAVMADLLQQLPEAPYRDNLLTHFPSTLAADQKLAAPLPLPQALRDPLTGRELEVLRLMTSHLSGPGIARELHISINTYKSHIKNIYGKLNVRSREDAVSRAQALRLI